MSVRLSVSRSSCVSACVSNARVGVYLWAAVCLFMCACLGRKKGRDERERRGEKRAKREEKTDKTNVASHVFERHIYIYFCIFFKKKLRIE